MKNLTRSISLTGKYASGGCRIIVIGVSRGGMQALRSLLSALPCTFEVPVVIVQHRSEQFEDILMDYLRRWSALPVSEPYDKASIVDNQVYIAPAGYHLLVGKEGFNLSVDEPMLHARPSVDVLFESAAESYGAGCIGIVLTGSGQDGAQGLAKIKAAGGLTVVEDPATAAVPSMPQTAIDIGAVDYVLPLDEIAHFLVEHCATELKNRHAG